jgi:hypothetical protein
VSKTALFKESKSRYGIDGSEYMRESAGHIIAVKNILL